MDAHEDIAVRTTAAQIDALKGYTGEIERLGGLTNRVYRLGDLVLRIAGEGTAEYINRGHERANAIAAAQAGVSPEVRHADPASGVMVTRYVAGTTTMTPNLFKERAEAPRRAAAALRKLHHSGAVFPFHFQLFSMVEDYLSILANKEADLPAGYHEVLAEASAIKTVLTSKPAALAPCHCDPLCENFLDTGTRMWIVDWEYAGMNDPMWDLGDLSVEGAFDAAQDEELLSGYFGGEARTSDRGRMIIYKAMCDLLWTLWGLIQHANNNPADDFRAYAFNRFNRCKELMSTADFPRHLCAISST